MAQDSLRELLGSTFEELVLAMGGAFVLYQIEDEAIWQIMKSVEAVYGKAAAKLNGMTPKEPGKTERSQFQPHPAVEALLLKLKNRKPYPNEAP